MGNYTSIEQEFSKKVEPRIKVLIESQPNSANNPLRQQQLNQIISETLMQMRKEKMQTLCNITGRNLICYFSAWLQSAKPNPEIQINDNDMNGLMNAISGLDDKSKGLDLMLHTPGGVVTATESIVKYLRKIFNMDIRVIVPHMAMSAGTMIACSCKEIIMGKQSSLGPIDPQYHNVPAQGVLKEFERAIQETMQAPNKSLIWREIIQQYRPSFVGECENVVKMSRELVEGWLQDCMFKDAEDKEQKTRKVLDELASHDASKVHDRHYDFNKCKELGLNVTALEDNQEIQEAVLSLYHCYLLSIYRVPTTIKYIESQHGESFIISGQR